VATKIDPPIAASWLLPRQALVDRLVDDDIKLCLICAPAGWGKTSLLAGWHVSDSASRFAFTHLDPDDDDDATFWTYLVAALRRVDPGRRLLEGADALLGQPGVAPMRRLVPQLVNELRSLDGPLFVVLDDYHVVSKAPIHDSVLYLIEHLPPSVRVVISTRADPPFPLGRLRASGEMTELRAAQLQLTTTEAAELLRNRFDVELDAESAELLCRRTEGWPAGIQLAGLALQDEADRAGFVKRFSGDNRNIADYLTGEVLDRLPAERTRFLKHTSILERLSGPLCDAVADVTDSAQTLEEMERANLFLVPLDHQREWYRYHHLFGEWLRHELRRTEPNHISQLHARASRWYEEANRYEAAISHAIAADEHERAAEIMDRYLLNPTGVQWPTVLRWLSRLPFEVKAQHPMVAIAEVRMAFSLGDFGEGHRWLPIAKEAIASTPADMRVSAETTVRLFAAFGELVMGDIDKARVSFGEIADEQRSESSSYFAVAIGYAGTASFWTEGPLAAIPTLRKAVSAQEWTSRIDTGVTALLAAAYAEIGDWTGAEETANVALALPLPHEGFRYPFNMPAHYALGQSLIARGDREAGVAEIKKGLEQARAWVEPIFVAYGCLLLADALDDFKEKRALVREARQLIEDGRGRGRIGGLVEASEHKLSLRQPSQRTAGTVHVESLTTRERDVLRWLRSDLSLAEIAREMFVSYNTVKGHTKAIYRKLGVTSRAAAVETGDQLDLV
jgi:LuxR family maltose regulon positive regulatory protein